MANIDSASLFPILPQHPTGIARLAAKDPSVQLKVGVLEWNSDLQIGDEEKKPTR